MDIKTALIIAVLYSTFLTIMVSILLSRILAVLGDILKIHTAQEGLLKTLLFKHGGYGGPPPVYKHFHLIPEKPYMPSNCDPPHTGGKPSTRENDPA